MTSFQWRKFQFFDIEKDIDKGVLSESLKTTDNNEAANITTISSGKGLLAIGDSTGIFYYITQSIAFKDSW